MHRCCALLLKFESLLCIVAEVGHFASETDTWRRAPDGRDLEPLDPVLEAAGSPSFAAFSASGPAIADGSEALEIELRLWWQKLERERAQSGQRATVAQSTTPSVDEAEQMADDGQYKFMLAWRLRKRMCVAARAVILRMCVAARAVVTARFNDCSTLVGGDDRPAAAACGRGVCRESIRRVALGEQNVVEAFMMLAYTDIRTAWPPLDCVPVHTISLRHIGSPFGRFWSAGIVMCIVRIP